MNASDFDSPRKGPARQTNWFMARASVALLALAFLSGVGCRHTGNGSVPELKTADAPAVDAPGSTNPNNDQLQKDLRKLLLDQGLDPTLVDGISLLFLEKDEKGWLDGCKSVERGQARGDDSLDQTIRTAERNIFWCGINAIITGLTGGSGDSQQIADSFRAMLKSNPQLVINLLTGLKSLKDLISAVQSGEAMPIQDFIGNVGAVMTAIAPAVEFAGGSGTGIFVKGTKFSLVSTFMGCAKGIVQGLVALQCLRPDNAVSDLLAAWDEAAAIAAKGGNLAEECAADVIAKGAIASCEKRAIAYLSWRIPRLGGGSCGAYEAGLLGCVERCVKQNGGSSVIDRIMLVAGANLALGEAGACNPSTSATCVIDWFFKENAATNANLNKHALYQIQRGVAPGDVYQCMKTIRDGCGAEPTAAGCADLGK